MGNLIINSKTDMHKLACLLILFLLSTGLATSQTKKEKKQMQEEAEIKEFEATKALIASGVYEFKPDWVTTNFDGHRTPVGRTFFRMNQEDLYAELPIFQKDKAIRRSTVAPVGVVGISEVKFEGKVEDYKVKINEKKRTIDVSFKRSSKRERYSFSFTIKHDGSATLFLQPATFAAMTYEGNVH